MELLELRRKQRIRFCTLYLSLMMIGLSLLLLFRLKTVRALQFYHLRTQVMFLFAFRWIVAATWCFWQQFGRIASLRFFEPIELFEIRQTRLSGRVWVSFSVSQLEPIKFGDLRRSNIYLIARLSRFGLLIVLLFVLFKSTGEFVCIFMWVMWTRCLTKTALCGHWRWYCKPVISGLLNSFGKELDLFGL